ncbi:Ig-like domain repeat protein [Methanobacterium sp. ACI-7]|uniref:Ig-like domain repeat protein n=1 Tax=unclassified Methanobacterium TaxID=2627676 RepID=UPI0039C16EF8
MMKQENTDKTKNNPKSLQNKFIIPLLLLSLVLIFSFTMGTVSAEFMSPSPTSNVIYVNGSNGSDDNDGLSWETAKLSILNATGTVDENGEINIADGQYTGTCNTKITITKNMTITGQSQTGTIINGTGTNWIFNIAYGVNVTIQNLTLTNGTTQNNGGAIWNPGGILTIENCNFTGNNAGWGGAIASWYSSTLTVSNCTFTDNNASYGGGAINMDSSSTTIRDSVFINNQAQYYGGALVNWNSQMTVTGCTFTDNSAISQNWWIYGGGAIFNTETLTAHFNRFNNNIAVNNEGNAIKNMYSDPVNAENNWWGSNNPNWTNLLSGVTNPTNWVILTINATPDTIYNTQNSTITADFNHINGGGDLTGVHIPDGPITLSTSWGSFTSSGITREFTANTVNGIISATFFAIEGAVNPLFNPVRVTATADGYTTNVTESAYITINPAADISINITFEDTNHNHINSTNYRDNVVIHLNVANNGPDMANWVVINDVIPPELDDSSFNIISNSQSWGYTYYYGSQRLTIYVGDIANGTSYDFWINVTNVGHNNNLITNIARLNTTETELYDPNPDNNNSTASYTANAATYVTIYNEFRNLPWGNIINTAHYNDKIYAIIKVQNLGPDSTSVNILDSLTGINWTGNYYVLSGSVYALDPNNWVLNDPINTFNGSHWNMPNFSSLIGGNVKWLAIEGSINQTGENAVSNYAKIINQSAYAYEGYDSSTAYLTANPAPTSLTFNSITGDKGKTVNLKATLVDTTHGNVPISGKIIIFKVNGVTVGNATTNASGVATLPYLIDLVGGNYTIDAIFAGDNEYAAAIGNGILKVNQSSIYVLTTVSKTNPTVGETITLNFKLGNNGPDPANDVVFTYRIPEGMEFVSLETEPGYPAATYDSATRTVTWSLGTVPILDPWLKINVKVLNAGVFNINPTVTTSTYDPNLATSVQSATINAVAQANAVSNTIGMQNTGLPIPMLVLALLGVFAGLVLPRRK